MKLDKFFLLVLSIGMLAGFSACGSDDDNFTERDMLGGWSLIEAQFDFQTNHPEMDATLKAEIEDMFDGMSLSFIFEDDMTYQSYSNVPELAEKGKYYMKGNTLYLKQNSSSLEEPVVIESLTLTKMTMRKDMKAILQQIIDDDYDGVVKIKKAILRMKFDEAYINR